MHAYGHISSYAKIVACYSGTKRTWKYFYRSAEELLAIRKLPPAGVTELMMLPNLSLSPFFTLPSPLLQPQLQEVQFPSAQRSPVAAVSWAKDNCGRERNHSTLPKGAASLKVNTTSQPQLGIGAPAFRMPQFLQQHKIWPLTKSLVSLQLPGSRLDLHRTARAKHVVWYLLLSPLEKCNQLIKNIPPAGFSPGICWTILA